MPRRSPRALPALVHAALPLAAALACAAPAGALADPGYYVVTAYDDAGLRSVDLRYWTVKSPGEAETIWPELGFSYGVNSRWTTELLYSTIGPSNWDVVPDYLSWQNNLLLTQGEWPVDVALHANLVRQLGVGGGHYALEYGPVLQTDVGRTQLNANLLFERSFGPDEPLTVALKYQWQLRHHWHPQLDFGAQGFGELGRWDHWATGGKQSHRAGPAVFGHVDWGSGDHQALLYQAAYLLGTVYQQKGSMFTVRVQYQF